MQRLEPNHSAQAVSYVLLLFLQLKLEAIQKTFMTEH